MKIEFDPAKNARNIAKRGLPFDLVAKLDWETAIAREDLRRDYGEKRIRILGFLEDRLHVAVVTYRNGAVRVISLRKASLKEIVWYENARE